MNVTIDFKAGELNQVLVVPTAALAKPLGTRIVQQPKAQGVFVAKTGGDPVFVPIVVGTTVNDKTEVKSGLTGNERVLLSFPPGTRKATAITFETIYSLRQKRRLVAIFGFRVNVIAWWGGLALRILC